ncbi:MAG: GNAT family N-acetyltransferase [Alphaproteobacteria bacterium]|nr:GNAT family N-acetyltransferase [Alphaproteobacteria bacterium]
MIVCRPALESDWSSIEGLLRACDLPIAGARDHLGDFVLAETQDRVVGCAGAEIFGEEALLRSVAVTGERREQGVGGKMVGAVLANLRGRGVKDVVLLTTTAEEFFAARGFRRIARGEVPASVQASAEFNGACPDSAIVMLRRL